jgi:tetraacyldisaccharide 4'-kinase
MTTAGIRRLGSEKVDRNSLATQPLAAFCGIGNPESFFDKLRREGFTLTLTRTFADHHHYKQSELKALANEARDKGAKGLITTAKDAVKLEALELKIPCYVFEIQIVIDDEDRLAALISEATKSKFQ